MSSLSPSPARRWGFCLLRAGLTAGLIYLLVFVNARHLFHTELYESGDLAANSLAVLRAEHGQQLYGTYSRWMFHHPGPALFYGEAAGEAAFYRWLRLTPTPYNAQVLVVIVLLASFFAAGISVAARWVRGGVFLALALVFAALHFTAVDGRYLLVSAWPAHVAPLIFFCMMIAAASVGAGRGEDLPLLALAGAFLIHLHVAQILFVGPMCLLAYAGLWWSCWRGRMVPTTPTVSLAKAGEVPPPSPAPTVAPVTALPWRIYRRSHRFAAFIAVCFALPILVDLLFPHGNFHQILAHLRTHHGEGHPFLTSLAYFLRFAAYKPSLPGTEQIFAEATTPHALERFLFSHPWTLFLWTGALLTPLLPLAVRVWRGKEPVSLKETPTEAVPTVAYASPAGRWRFLAWLWVVWCLSVGLTLFWGTIQDGDMFYFNAWFNYAIWFALALLAAGALSDALDALAFRAERAAFWKVGVPAVGVLLAGFVLTRHPERFRATHGDGPEDRAAHASVADRLATEPAGTQRGKLLVFPPTRWEAATTVAVQLARAGRPAYVTPDWEFMFGPDHQLANWAAATSKPADINPDFEVWHLAPKDRVSGDEARYPLIDGQMLVPGGLPIDPAAAPAIVWEGADANVNDYMIGGWSEDDKTCERRAVIQFRARPVPDTAEVKLTVDFTVYPFEKRRGPQRIELRHNGNDLGTLTFSPDAPGPQSVKIPAALWNRYGPVLLTMDFPDAVSIYDTGEGPDRRPFAFAAKRITFALQDAEGTKPAETKPEPVVPEAAPTPAPGPTAPPAEPMATPETTPAATPLPTPVEPSSTPAETPMATPAPAEPTATPTATPVETVTPAAMTPNPGDTPAATPVAPEVTPTELMPTPTPSPEPTV